MKTIPDVLRSSHAKRLFVAIAVATGGAAVAGAVVLAERPGRSVAAVAPVAAEPVAVALDRSLPSAADALGGGAGAAEDAPSTF